MYDEEIFYFQKIGLPKSNLLKTAFRKVAMSEEFRLHLFRNDEARRIHDECKNKNCVTRTRNNLKNMGFPAQKRTKTYFEIIYGWFVEWLNW